MVLISTSECASLRERVEDRSQPTIQDAKDSQKGQFKKGIVSEATWERLDLEYKHTMNDIQVLAQEQCQLGFMEEGNEHRHRGVVGAQILPSRNYFIHEERENTINRITQSNHTDNSAWTASEGPIDERRSDGSLPSASILQREHWRDSNREHGRTPRSYSYVPASPPIRQHYSRMTWASSATNPVLPTFATSSLGLRGTLQKNERMKWKEEGEQLAKSRRGAEKVQRMEREASRKVEEVRREEEDAKRRDENACKEELEMRKRLEMLEDARKEEMKRREEETVKRREELMKWREMEVKRREEEMQRKEEEELKRREQMRKREEGIKKREDDARKKAEEVRRLKSKARKAAACAARAERKRQRNLRDQGVPRQQYTGSSNSDSISNWSTLNWSTLNSPWSTTTKLTAIPSQSTAQSSPSIRFDFGKPATRSVSSRTHPSAASPFDVSERNWTRRQEEIHYNQQEKFRRRQEKINPEIQRRSAREFPSQEEYVHAPVPIPIPRHSTSNGELNEAPTFTRQNWHPGTTPYLPSYNANTLCQECRALGGLQTFPTNDPCAPPVGNGYYAHVGLPAGLPVPKTADLLSPIYEVSREDEAELLTPNVNQTVPLPSQNSRHGTAPWTLTSHKPYAPKKPLNDEFMACMDLRRRQNGTSSISSTPQTKQTALLGSPASFASSACSQPFPFVSPSPVVEFPPTPIFTDVTFNGLMRKVEPSFPVAQTPRAFAPSNLYPLQNPHNPVTATRSFGTIDEMGDGACGSTASLNSNPAPRQQRPLTFPAPTSSVRQGYWSCGGGHLTPEGHCVFPPQSM